MLEQLALSILVIAGIPIVWRVLGVLGEDLLVPLQWDGAVYMLSWVIIPPVGATYLLLLIWQ